MIRHILCIIICMMLLSCNSSEIKINDPVTGTSGVVQNEDFYKGITHIQNDLKPLFLKYYKQNGDIPNNLSDFESVVDLTRSDYLSDRYCTIKTKNMGSYAYISITMRDSQDGCTNPIFWDITLNEEQRRKEHKESFKDVSSILKEELNNPYK